MKKYLFSILLLAFLPLVGFSQIDKDVFRSEFEEVQNGATIKTEIHFQAAEAFRS